MVLHRQFPSLLTKKTAMVNLFIIKYVRSFWGPDGGPWGEGWVMGHSIRVTR